MVFTAFDSGEIDLGSGSEVGIFEGKLFLTGGESGGVRKGIRIGEAVYFDVLGGFGAGDDEAGGVGIGFDEGGRIRKGDALMPFGIRGDRGRCFGILLGEVFERGDFGFDGVDLGRIGDERQELVVGCQGLRQKAGLLLDFSQIVEVLSFGRLEDDCLLEVVYGVLSVAFFGKERGKIAGDLGVILIVFLGVLQVIYGRV